MDVSIIIPTWNGKKYLTTCIESILSHTAGVNYELIIIDNGSNDGTVDVLTDYENASSHIKVIYNNSNLLFAKACNQGYEISKGKYIIIGNDDIILFDNAILKLFETAESINNSASISPLFISEDRTAQEAYRRLPNIFFVFAFYNRFGKALDRFLFQNYFNNKYLYRDKEFTNILEVEEPGASFNLFRKSIIQQLGYLFDEQFGLLFNDVDLFRRIKNNGYTNYLDCGIKVIHLGSLASQKISNKEYTKINNTNMKKYFNKHHRFSSIFMKILFPF